MAARGKRTSKGKGSKTEGTPTEEAGTEASPPADASSPAPKAQRRRKLTKTDEAGAEASPPADASSPVPKAQRPRLRKLTIRNLRCIGPEPVNIELDDIVVLVGPNNAGKSTILFAYELAMNQGSKKERLALSDFPNGKVDPENLPQIELETVIHGTEMPAAKWVQVEENGDHVVRERWTWERHDASPSPDRSRVEGAPRSDRLISGEFSRLSIYR